MRKKRTIELVEKMESTMFENNQMFGDAGTYCDFCESREYDGWSGILHKPNCLISQMKDWLLVNRDDAVVGVSEQ